MFSKGNLRASLPSEMRDAIAPNLKTGEEKKYAESLMRSHELDESRMKPWAPFCKQGIGIPIGRVSPDVLMSESNKAATSPAHLKPIGNNMFDFRNYFGELQGIQQTLPYFKYSETRLGRAEKKYVAEAGLQAWRYDGRRGAMQQGAGATAPPALDGRLDRVCLREGERVLRRMIAA